MGQLLEGHRQSLAHQLSERGAELVIESAPGLVGDRLVVEQIFGNLIENAVKYLKPDRPGRIVVRGSDLGSAVRYEVEDNGRGIEAKDFERIRQMLRKPIVVDAFFGSFSNECDGMFAEVMRALPFATERPLVLLDAAEF